MTLEPINFLGCEVVLVGPKSCDDYDTLTKPGEALERVMTYDAYHEFGPAFRKALVDKLKASHGLERQVKRTIPSSKPDGKATQILETEATAIERGLKEGKITKADIQSTGDGILTEWGGGDSENAYIEFVKKMATTTVKVPKEFLALAETLAGNIADGTGSYEKLVSNIQALVPSWQPDVENGVPTVQSLAVGLKRLNDFQKKSMASLTA